MSLARLRLPSLRILRACSSANIYQLCTVQRLVLKLSQQQRLQSAANPALLNRTFTRGFSAEKSAVIFNVESDEDFAEKVVNSSVPVLVDFYADWCGPCKMLGPRLEAKIEGQNGSLLLAKVNVDFAADLAMEHEVNAVPTILAFKNGELVHRAEGDQGDAYFDELIQNLLSE